MQVSTRANEIHQQLTAHFSPQSLSVISESHLHRGNQQDMHFKITLITEHFNHLSRLARHRAVYQCLTSFLKQGVHALALHLYTPKEWETHRPFASPPCKGGEHGTA